jgi:hypothetical protein
MVPIPVVGSRWQAKGGWVQDPGERCNRLGVAGAGRDLVVGERDHAVVADCRQVLGRREAAQELQLLLPGGRAVVVPLPDSVLVPADAWTGLSGEIAPIDPAG